MKNPKDLLITRILEKRRKQRTWFNNPPHRQIPNNNSPADATSFVKGTAFESFIVRKFDPQYFSLIEWRSDKSIDYIFPIMGVYPDLEFYFESSTESLQFAVECKWKDHFSRNYFDIEPHKLENYRYFEKVMKIPTFLALGVGDAPNRPGSVYMVPLREIKSEKLHEFELEIYRKKNQFENFFLDSKQILIR